MCGQKSLVYGTLLVPRGGSLLQAVFLHYTGIIFTQGHIKRQPFAFFKRYQNKKLL